MDSVRSSAGSCGASGGSAAYPNASGHTGGLALISNGREVIPALGIAWANCINARIFLSKAATPGGERNLVYSGPPSAATQAAVAGGMAQLPRFALQLRHMQFVFSPMLPQRRCAYLVEVTGIRGLLPCEDAAAEPLR